jgi:hypothetical protein
VAAEGCFAAFTAAAQPPSVQKALPFPKAGYAHRD